MGWWVGPSWPRPTESCVKEKSSFHSDLAASRYGFPGNYAVSEVPSFPGEAPCIAPTGVPYYTPGNAPCY